MSARATCSIREAAWTGRLVLSFAMFLTAAHQHGVEADEPLWAEAAKRIAARYERPTRATYETMEDVDLAPPPGETALTAANIGGQFTRSLYAQAKIGKLQLVQSYVGRARRPSLEAARPRDNWTVLYQLQQEGVPFSSNSRVTVIALNAGARVLRREVRLPNPEAIGAAEATVAAEAALATAEEDFRRWVGKQEIVGSNPEEAVRPVKEYWVDDDGVARLAWRIDLQTREKQEYLAIRYWTPARQEDRDQKEFFDQEMLVYGAVGASAAVWPEGHSSHTGQTADRPLAELAVQRHDGLTRFTNQAGEYSFPPTGNNANAMFRVDLSGRFCKIHNEAGATIQTSVNGSGGGAALHIAASNESELAQTTAYYWVTDARRFCIPMLGPAQLAPTQTFVNIDDHCNAFFAPLDVSLNFFQSGQLFGSDCPNTATMDIAYHEFGHAVDFVLGGISDGGYSEGFGDALSILRFDNPIVGVNFFGVGSHLRDYNTINRTWPVNTTEPHDVGEIYGRFTVDLLDELEQFLGGRGAARDVAKDLVFGAAVFDPVSIPDAVLLKFFLDDDDGDLSNGSPHFLPLARAAKARGLLEHPDFATIKQVFEQMSP